MKTILLICFAIALFLSLIKKSKKRSAQQYENDVKENSGFPSIGFPDEYYPETQIFNSSILNANKAELISQKLTALVEEPEIAKEKPSLFDEEIKNLWFKQTGLKRTGLKYLMITEKELLDFAEHYHKAKS